MKCQICKRTRADHVEMDHPFEEPTCPLCAAAPATVILEERRFSAVDPRGELVYSTLACEPCASLAKAMHEHDQINR